MHISIEAALIRSLLYVPGDSSRKLAKAREVPADAFIVDWEDAVADERKGEARAVTAAAMPGLVAAGSPVLIRLNPPKTSLAKADCDAIREISPKAVVVPKCGEAADVDAVLELLGGSIPVFAMIETPGGVHEAYNIASCSELVLGLMFGAEDYCAEVGILRSPGEPEVAFARGSVVNSARAARREVFDSPVMQYGDKQEVRRAAARGKRLGFSGQAAIHPSQVAVINDTFLPSPDEILAARSVLERYMRHGGGVYGVESALEDKPAVEAARRVIDLQQRFGA